MHFCALPERRPRGRVLADGQTESQFKITSGWRGWDSKFQAVEPECCRPTAYACSYVHKCTAQQALRRVSQNFLQACSGKQRPAGHTARNSRSSAPARRTHAPPCAGTYQMGQDQAAVQASGEADIYGRLAQTCMTDLVDGCLLPSPLPELWSRRPERRRSRRSPRALAPH